MTLGESVSEEKFGTDNEGKEEAAPLFLVSAVRQKRTNLCIFTDNMDINLQSHRFYFPPIYCAEPGAQPQLTEFKVR